MVEPGEPDSLDMARTLANYSFIVGEQIFEGLFRWTPKGLVPWLARHPPGVAGREDLDAQAPPRRHVPRRHAVQRGGGQVQPGAHPGRQGLRVRLACWRPSQTSRRPTMHTVQITMKAPYGPFRALLGFIYFGMQSPTALQKKHGENSGSNPVGTGPFKFQSWQRGSELTLVPERRLLGRQGAVGQDRRDGHPGPERAGVRAGGGRSGRHRRGAAQRGGAPLEEQPRPGPVRRHQPEPVAPLQRAEAPLREGRRSGARRPSPRTATPTSRA